MISLYILSSLIIAFLQTNYGINWSIEIGNHKLIVKNKGKDFPYINPYTSRNGSFGTSRTGESGNY